MALPAAVPAVALRDVTLDDKYELGTGRVFLTGVQALVRLLMLQRQRDAAAGLDTGGFVSGYRGSPLGGLDQALWKAEKFLQRAHIKFQPGLNEDLAATAIWGTQQVTMYKDANVDGVFAMWYGKGPGVDRCGDVFKHANFAGTSKHGGVLVLAGDDHAAKSSTLPHQSDHQFSAAMMPVLYPSSVQEILDLDYTLEHKYTRAEGRIYLSGVQALVRLPLMQQMRDRAAGLNTAGFISGYRGSPLGMYDYALWNARPFLEKHRIHFQPGVNEDLAATAVWGSQQVNLFQGAEVDGVFGIWYGKGPGVDRSMDALKHANSAGSSRHGGVLALAGDDHGCQSSTLAHQSEQVFAAALMPVINPSTLQEYLDLGLYGFALSRYS
ncbi:MAG TPA: hypothetical protein VG868_01360, partial [Casimicrobiaceae bacterium]|nr:hypothetical protein [Casimicrobiaceae bacterium]